MMVRFRDWSLVIKLMVSPALISVVVFVAAYVSFSMINHKVQGQARIVAELRGRETAVARLRASIAEADMMVFRATVAQTQNVPATERQWLRKDALRRLAEVEHQADFKGREALFLIHEKPYLQSMHDAIANYVAIVRNILQTAPQDFTPVSVPFNEVMEHFAVVDSAITAWENYKSAAYRYLEQKSHDDLRQTMLGFAIFVGIVVCAAFTLTMVIGRYITAPIQNVVHVMENLATGDHDVSVIEVDRKDEVGAMMASVAAFRAKLQTLNEQAAVHDAMQQQTQGALQLQIEKLAASEQRLRDIAESTSDWFWESDVDDRVTMVSQRFYDVTGLTPPQVIGSYRLAYAKPSRGQDEVSRWVAYAKKITQQQGFRNLDYRVQAGGGNEICVRSSGMPYFDSSGRFKGYRGASTDITALIRAQEELETSRNHLLGITSNLFEGVFMLALDGEILFANPSAHRLLQFQLGTLQGRHVDEVLQVIVHGRDVEYVRGPMHRVFAIRDTRVDENAKFRLVANQETLSVAYACTAISEEGGVPSVVVSFRSIEALKQAQSEALQSSRLASVGQLAAGIAHEINTPIQYVGDNMRFFERSFAVLNHMLVDIRKALDSDEVPERIREQIQGRLEDADADYLMEKLPDAARQSLDGVEHVANIVHSMKEFSHPGSGAAKVMTDINRAIESTLVVSINEWKHNAVIEKDLVADLPMVLCLPAEINQVLLNIIVNAAHALDGQDGDKQKGKIWISTRHLGHEIEIRIADNGPGVPENIREHIFDPFFTTKSVGKGTGQGLAISMDVVVMKHNGKLRLEDTPGGGATFVIRLPVDDKNIGQKT